MLKFNVYKSIKTEKNVKKSQQNIRLKNFTGHI